MPKTSKTSPAASTARRLRALIRNRYNKPPEAFVTINELSEFTGIGEEEIVPSWLGRHDRINGMEQP
jgi:hypothetical protein